MKKTPLTRAEFKEYLDYMKETIDLFDEVAESVDTHRTVSADTAVPCPTSVTHIITLMERLFDMRLNADGHSVLSWWVYDAEFGKNTEAIRDYAAKTGVYIETINDLYDHVAGIEPEETDTDLFEMGELALYPSDFGGVEMMGTPEVFELWSGSDDSE